MAEAADSGVNLLFLVRWEVFGWKGDVTPLVRDPCGDDLQDKQERDVNTSPGTGEGECTQQGMWKGKNCCDRALWGSCCWTGGVLGRADFQGH